MMTMELMWNIEVSETQNFSIEIYSKFVCLILDHSIAVNAFLMMTFIGYFILSMIFLIGIAKVKILHHIYTSHA